MVATFVSVFSKLAADSFIGVLLGSAVAVACFQNFSLRPQTVVWMLFAVSLLAANRARYSGVSWRIALGILGIFCLWANSHITTVIGIGAIFLWALNREKPALAFKLACIAFLGTLITPYFGGEWLTFFSQTGDPINMGSIAEFQPATIMRFGSALLIIMSALLIAGVAKTPQFFSPPQLILALILVCAGSAIVKFIPFAAITLAALLSVYWRTLQAQKVDSAADPLSGEAISLLLEKRTGLIEGIEKLRALGSWFPTSGSAFLLFAMLAVTINSSSQSPMNTTAIPVAAVNFIKEHNLAPPLLNDFGRGGYVMYRMSDEHGVIAAQLKVPIDGRTNVNSPEIWKAYRAAVEGQAEWKKILDLVKPNTILWRRDSPFVELLKSSGEWQEVFPKGSTREGGFVVLVRDP